MHLATLSQNQNEHITIQENNQDLIGLFILEDLEKITANEFYLKFRELFLSGEKDILNKIETVQEVLLKQNCYDKYLFFLKYYKINLEGEENILFNKELFESSNTLEQFLNNLSEKIYFILSKILNKKNDEGFCGLNFTTENILISNKELTRNGLFGLDEEQGEKLLYGCIRYFILERGINFPKIKIISNYSGSVFMEFNESYAERMLLNFVNINGKVKKKEKPLKEIKKYPGAKDFIIFCVKNFSLTSKNKSEAQKMGEFSIANAITIYTGEHINSFSFEDMKKILLASIDYKGSMIQYMLSTEMPILKEIINGIDNISKVEVEKLSINEFIYFYITGYIKNILKLGITFYLNENDNTFHLSNKTFDDILKKTSNSKILTRENKIKAFLGQEVDILAKMLGLLQENLNSNNSELLKEGVHIINLNSDEKLINLLINTIYNRYLTKDYSHNEEINLFLRENIINDTIDIIAKKTEEALKKGHNIYSKLNLNYNEIFLPIGGKIHFKAPLSIEKAEKLKEASLFEATPFKLQHSNESMLLPPCESPFQLIAILKKLHDIGIISDGDLELQLSIAGRLPNELSGILGSSMIFMKNYQISYPKEAFSAGDWNQFTGSCIVCYDAGVLEKQGFENISNDTSGRTDVLGVRKIEEVINFSILSNIISQSYFGGPIQEIGIKFINEYKKLLQKYNISDILEGKWVHNPDKIESINNKEKYDNHYELVKQCTDILNQNISDFNKTGDINSLIFELRELLGKYIKKYDLLKLPESKKNTEYSLV